MSYMESLGKGAKDASRDLSISTTAKRNELLECIAQALEQNAQTIIQSNKLDLENAVKNNMSPAMQDRLTLDQKRIEDIVQATRKLISLPDPLGEVERGFTLPNGLEVKQIRVPIGVVGIIFESRPNVTVDAAAICVKTGNAVILRGGKEAINTNLALIKVMKSAAVKCGFDENIINLVEDTSREVANEMMHLNGYLDVLIPRGGAGLINAVKNNATVPVIETGAGVCHVYVDKSADLDMAVKIIDNAKTQRPSVCNAAETLLVHKDIADTLLPMVKTALDKSAVVLYGCDRTFDILGDCVQKADDATYATEYNDYKMSVKVVDSTDEAIEHIAKYSTHHSESIITNDYEQSQKFTKMVDSACVYVNASTRFTDGGEFGFGAEIGISTQKLHARGPMGLKEMTSTKYVINGCGQIR